MRRVTIAFPDEMDERILALRKERGFGRDSYNEIVRFLVALGLVAIEENRKGQPEV